MCYGSQPNNITLSSLFWVQQKVQLWGNLTSGCHDNVFVVVISNSTNHGKIKLLVSMGTWSTGNSDEN